MRTTPKALPLSTTFWNRSASAMPLFRRCHLPSAMACPAPPRSTAPSACSAFRRVSPLRKTDRGIEAPQFSFLRRVSAVGPPSCWPDSGELWDVWVAMKSLRLQSLCALASPLRWCAGGRSFGISRTRSSDLMGAGPKPHALSYAATASPRHRAHPGRSHLHRADQLWDIPDWKVAQ